MRCGFVALAMDTQEVGRIRGQFQSGHWPQFLERLEISGLRGWTGQSITFAFPVVALVGENGTGKSTVLKAAAAAYENPDVKRTHYPSTFFVETVWDRIQNVVLRFRIKRGSNVDTFEIKKRSTRWSFPEKRAKREVFFLDISRTVPLDASVGYARIAKLAAHETATENLTDESRERLSHVLGRDYRNARFATSNVDTRRKVGLLERDFGEISQFHQGAGEDATLDLFRILEGVPENALVIIDEVEASLHPRAQRRLVRFLLLLSRTRRLQVVLSTHSPYVLQELPDEARVLLLSGAAGVSVVPAASPEFALTRIDDEAHPELTVFTEDKESSVMFREIVARAPEAETTLSRIRLVEAGPANVVQILGGLGASGKLPYKAVGLLDGDCAEAPGCIKAPGTEAPERVVWEGLKQKGWRNLPERFGIGAGALFDALEDAMRDPDHHRWNQILGDRVRKSASSVWELLSSEWARNCLEPTELLRVRKEIEDRMLPLHAQADPSQSSLFSGAGSST